MDELRKSFLTAVYWSLLKWSRIRLFKLEYEVFFRVRGESTLYYSLDTPEQKNNKQPNRALYFLDDNLKHFPS